MRLKNRNRELGKKEVGAKEEGLESSDDKRVHQCRALLVL